MGTRVQRPSPERIANYIALMSGIDPDAAKAVPDQPNSGKTNQEQVTQTGYKPQPACLLKMIRYTNQTQSRSVQAGFVTRQTKVSKTLTLHQTFFDKRGILITVFTFRHLTR
jgi:hypothetical protein